MTTDFLTRLRAARPRPGPGALAAGRLGVATLLAAVRLLGHKSPAFQAIAHLFLGGLLGAGLVAPAGSARPYYALAAGLTAVETCCFFFA
jgi:hypothetical protein